MNWFLYISKENGIGSPYSSKLNWTLQRICGKKFSFYADEDIGKCIFNHIDFVQIGSYFNEFPASTLKFLFFFSKKGMEFFSKHKLMKILKMFSRYFSVLSTTGC